MKFGTIPEDDLGQVDFTLLPDPPGNSAVLGGRPDNNPKIYLGCGNWGHASWSGVIYPPKTPATRFRELYPLHFNAFELNATHYAIYPRETIMKWAEPARGRDFKYCPKFPQSISHYSAFTKTEAATDAFLQGIVAFGDNLGPAFLQVSDTYSPLKKDPLFTYLASLPRDIDIFLELRHPDWFTQTDRFLSELVSIKKGLVITDTPGRRDCAHMHLTIPKLMLRFVSQGRHQSTMARIEAWSARIARWINCGLSEAYIFLHPGDEALIPEYLMAWTVALNRATEMKLPLPDLAKPSLF